MSRHSADSAAYRRATAKLRATVEPVCAGCLGWIDRSLPSTHPASWTADHVEALAAGGDPLGELVPMHRACNASKGSGIPRTSRKRATPPHP